ncbi:MAG TPA: hypothetical protein VFN97_02215 [Actinospica sp.]|nr:hypothetical protein [Actinospica sp.]
MAEEDLGLDAAKSRRPGVEVQRRAAQSALPLAVVLWLWSLRWVRLDRMGEFGLISILPVLFWVALGVLALGFALTLRQPTVATSWLVAYVLALIAMLHATPTLLYGTLRYAWSWEHVAIIDYLVRHGGVDPSNGSLSPYNKWPGFFALNAAVIRMTGLRSSLGYAAWAPPVFNALMVPPLVLIFRTMTKDRRVMWGAIWLFSCCQWTGQDYFSPQAYAFVLYLAVLGIVLNRWNKADDPLGTARPSRAVDAVWIVLLVPLIAAIAASHQLTPLALVLSLAVLALSRYRTTVLLWALAMATVFAVVWDSTVGLPFIRSNLSSIVQTIGKLGSNATIRLTGAASASFQQQVVAYVETGTAAFIGLLALAAALSRRDLRRSRAVFIAVAPLPLLAANGYGGEMVIRVYLFALAGAVFLGTAWLVRSRWNEKSRGAVFHGIAFLMIAAFIVANYGKEGENYFSPAQVAATDYMYRVAPHGSLIVAATMDYPGDYLDYENHYQTFWLDQLTPQQTQAVERDPVRALEAVMSVPGRQAYFILTKSQETEIETEGLLSPAALDRLRELPQGAPQFRVVYRNADAVVLTLDAPPASAP